MTTGSRWLGNCSCWRQQITVIVVTVVSRQGRVFITRGCTPWDLVEVSCPWRRQRQSEYSPCLQKSNTAQTSLNTRKLHSMAASSAGRLHRDNVTLTCDLSTPKSTQFISDTRCTNNKSLTKIHQQILEILWKQFRTVFGHAVSLIF